MEDLNLEAEKLVKSSMAISSWKTYNTASNSFSKFRDSLGLSEIWPAPVDHLALFIAYLSHKGMASSSVITYISGLSHMHKFNNWIDNTQCFLISKMLLGLRKERPQNPDVRVPISLGLLKRLILSLKSVCTSLYEAHLFSAAFSLAFFALLRVSEIAVYTNRDHESGHALNFENVSFKQDKGQSELHIVIRSSKTDQYAKSITLVVQEQLDIDICPVKLLRRYFSIRFSGMNGSNKLFVHFDGSPLTRFQFCSVLKKCLAFCEVPLHVRSHSFRIGRATDLAINGVSDEQIKTYGRWSSSSYLRYIRL